MQVDGQEMLLEWYHRWVKNYKRSLIHISSGEEAGIKSVKLKISGENFLKNESGIHRLVRVSPFDTQREDIQKVCRDVWVYLKLQIQ